MKRFKLLRTYWRVFKSPENFNYIQIPNRSLIFDFCLKIAVEALSQQQPLEYCIDYE